MVATAVRWFCDGVEFMFILAARAAALRVPATRAADRRSPHRGGLARYPHPVSNAGGMWIASRTTKTFSAIPKETTEIAV